jgi:hypothetical protein
MLQVRIHRKRQTGERLENVFQLARLDTHPHENKLTLFR